MYQQNIQQLQAQQILPEEDMAYTVLADLKRVVKEYATAATEAGCQQIRETFTTLLNNTLRMQGELYKVMQQNNMYDKPIEALRPQVDKQLQQQQQTQQKADQFLQRVGLDGLTSYGGQQTRLQQNQYPASPYQPVETRYQQQQPQAQPRTPLMAGTQHFYS